MDNGMPSTPLKQGVVQCVRKSLGSVFDHKNICITGTHTHSGPGTLVIVPTGSGTLL